MLETRIREYRERAGMKQSDLAEAVGVRRETVVHLENGRYNPSILLAHSIAAYFGLTIEDIFIFEEETK